VRGRRGIMVKNFPVVVVGRGEEGLIPLLKRIEVVKTQRYIPF